MKKSIIEQIVNLFLPRGSNGHKPLATDTNELLVFCGHILGQVQTPGLTRIILIIKQVSSVYCPKGRLILYKTVETLLK